jgi:hypothetical protein
LRINISNFILQRKTAKIKKSLENPHKNLKIENYSHLNIDKISPKTFPEKSALLSKKSRKINNFRSPKSHAITQQFQFGLIRERKRKKFLSEIFFILTLSLSHWRKNILRRTFQIKNGSWLRLWIVNWAVHINKQVCRVGNSRKANFYYCFVSFSDI